MYKLVGYKFSEDSADKVERELISHSFLSEATLIILLKLYWSETFKKKILK